MFYKNFIVLITISVSISFNCMSSEVSTDIVNSTQTNSIKLLDDEQVKAIKSGDLEAVKKMIDSGFSTESCDKDGNTILILSLLPVDIFPTSHPETYKNKIEVAKYLIEKGANIEAQDAESNATPLLIVASYFNSIRLSEDGSNIFISNKNFSQIRYNFINYLISKNVKLEAIGDLLNHDALCYAIRTGDERLVELIVYSGVDLNKDYIFHGRNLNAIQIAEESKACLRRYGSPRGIDRILAESYRAIINILQTYQRHLLNVINQYLPTELSPIVKSYVMR